jgi:hypothetical protein
MKTVKPCIYDDIWQQAIVAGWQVRSQSDERYKRRHAVAEK